MTMDTRRTINDLCVEVGKREGVDPKRISILHRGSQPSREMTLEMTNLHKFETVHVLVKNNSDLHLRSDDEDDSPSDAMSLCHGRPIQDKEVPSITILIECMAPYMDTQMTCVISGDNFLRVWKP